MDKTPLTIVVGIAFLSLTASAQMRRPDLSKYFNPAAIGGFSVPSHLEAPYVAEPKRFITVAELVNETAQVLSLLSRELVEKKSASGENKEVVSGDTVRALMGQDKFSGEKLIPIGYATERTGPIKYRGFYVTDIRHKTDIIIIELDKPAKILRAYLVSVDGTLESAVETIKVDGKFINENVPTAKVEVFFKTELAFWKDYYLTHIKGTKSASL